MSRHARWSTALALAVAGCSDPAPNTASGAPPADELRIGLDEYEVRASHTSALPETLTLEITNTGREAHDLRVDGAGDPIATEVLAPGEATVIEVDAAGADELALWCTLPGHRSQGMQTTLTVTGADGRGS